MCCTRNAVRAAIVPTLVLGHVATVSIGVGIVKLWPVAWTWTRNALGQGHIDAARRAVAQLGVRYSDDRIVQLCRTGPGWAGVAVLAGNRELAQVLQWTAALPAAPKPLVQNVPNIGQIRLDLVASPEVRALRAEFQQAVAKRKPSTEGAYAVITNVLGVLKREPLALLSQDPGFSRLLSGSDPDNEPDSGVA